MPEPLREKDKKAFSFIRNLVVHQGRFPTLREINDITGNTSPRSASLLLERLAKAGYIKKEGRKARLADVPTPRGISTVKVPLIGSVACGMPILAQENIETFIAVSTALAKPGAEYFLLRAKGTSMNKAGIPDGSVVLVRQQATADIGKKVVALIDDEATIKVFDRTKDAVILRPNSTDKKHKPIVVTENCEIQGVVIATLPANL